MTALSIGRFKRFMLSTSWHLYDSSRHCPIAVAAKRGQLIISTALSSSHLPKSSRTSAPSLRIILYSEHRLANEDHLQASNIPLIYTCALSTRSQSHLRAQHDHAPLTSYTNEQIVRLLERCIAMAYGPGYSGIPNFESRFVWPWAHSPWIALSARLVWNHTNRHSPDFCSRLERRPRTSDDGRGGQRWKLRLAGFGEHIGLG